MDTVADPRSAPPLRWGIIGAGSIAGKFTNAVTKHTSSTVIAVGSRDRDRAERFAAANQIPVAHLGYDALVADPEVEAVYVATPHSEHCRNALLSIAAGKPVLVEKPFTRNAREATAVMEAAAAAGLFAMEAMWTRFLPHMVALRGVLARGEIGEVVHVHAEHGQHFAFDPAGRAFDPDLAGGALLDLGVYPLSFVHDVLGPPTQVLSAAQRAQTGVDGQVSMILSYPGRTQATVSTTLWGLSAISASITGTEGRIACSGPFLRPTGLSVLRRDGQTWDFDAQVANGFQYEVAEAARCIAEGRIESDVLPLHQTREVLTVMDAVRQEHGLLYPGEDG